MRNATIVNAAFTADQVALDGYVAWQNFLYVIRCLVSGWTLAERDAESIESLAERGVFNIREYKRQELLQVISDMSKDAYGFRMRRNYGEWTLEELEAEANSFQATIEEDLRRDEEYYAQKAESDRLWEKAEEARREDLAVDLGIDIATLERWEAQCSQAEEEYYNQTSDRKWTHRGFRFKESTLESAF
jgi:hypothetical protein